MGPELNFPTFDLTGRKALVTGAGKGIGKSLALALLHFGANVVLSGRNEEALAEIASKAKDLKGKAFIEKIDVSELASIKKGVANAAEKLCGLDILINNAGVEQVSDSLEIDEALWDKILGINLKGSFFCAQAAAKLMAGKGKGSIVNLCSLTSFVGVPTAVPYTSSKSGLMGMTKALSAEWAKKGIRVNAIAPGYFRTDLTDVFYQDQNWCDSMISKIPMARFGKLDDLMGVVVFLCSDAAAYITGQVIAVDGGYLASI